eukprot:1576455-Rhodomonas_salina.1
MAEHDCELTRQRSELSRLRNEGASAVPTWGRGMGSRVLHSEQGEVMEDEHKSRADSKLEFTTKNYGGTVTFPAQVRARPQFLSRAARPFLHGRLCTAVAMIQQNGGGGTMAAELDVSSSSSGQEWEFVVAPDAGKEYPGGPRAKRGIQELLAHPNSQAAGLTEPEIIALRLYTGPM